MLNRTAIRARLALTNLFIIALLAAVLPATAKGAEQSPAFASPLFQSLWEYSDKLVQERPDAGRGYTWGPNSFGTFQEFYAKAPGDKRLVQYFDKSRMEISQKDGQTYVTNGLLTKELVTGLRQDGDELFTQYVPSAVQVVGDDNSNGANNIAPVYSSFRAVISIVPGQNRAVNEVGKDALKRIERNGTVSTLININPAETPPTVIGYYEPIFGHNVPQVFLDFQNQTGLVWNAGRQTYQPQKIYTDNPTANVFGLPVSEPYWTRAVVGGVEKWVLVQLFERRVLTYTPSNAAPFKVEMGNIGQHYYRWRYPQKEEPIPGLDFRQARAPYLKSGSVVQGGINNISRYDTGQNYNSSWPVYDPDKKLALVARGQELVALDLSNFASPVLRWAFQGPDGFSPVTLFNGVVYITGEGGKIYAINELTGTKIWENQIAGLGTDSPIAIDLTSIYFRAGDQYHNQSALYALDRNSGAILWSAIPGEGIASGPVMASDGSLFVGTKDKKVYAYRRDGTQIPANRWNIPTLDAIPSRYAISVDGSHVYVGTTNGTLYALNFDGTIQSQRTFTAGQAILTVPAIATIKDRFGTEITRVFVGSDDGSYYGVDANDVSKVEWVFEPEPRNVARSSPAVVDNYVYFGSDNGNVYRVDATNPGDNTILAATGQPFGTVPPVVNSGYLFIITYNGVFYAIK
jgi:outer membrane protein assembly factor BamB